MKLFNRNEDIKEDVNGLKEDIVNLSKVLDEVEVNMDVRIGKTEEKVVEILSEKIRAVEGKFDELSEDTSKYLNQDKEEIQKLNEKVELLENENQDLKSKVKKVYEIVMKSLVNQQEVEDKVAQAIADAEMPSETKKHLFEVGGTHAKPYRGVMLDGERLISKRGQFSFNVLTVIGIKDNLQKYKEQGISVKEIGHKHNISTDTIYRIIWNIEEGYFDDVIEEYNKIHSEDEVKNIIGTNEGVEEKMVHIREVPNSLKNPISSDMLMETDGSIFINGRKLKYNMDDVLKLKKNIPNTEDYPTIASLIEGMEISGYSGAMLVWRIEEGNFDILIKEYSKILDKNRKYHIFPLKKSYQQKFKGFRLGEDGTIFNTNNRRLPYTIQDIIEMRKTIYSGRYTSVNHIVDKFDYCCSRGLCLKLIWNIEEGNFDELIEEYSSRNYTYENKHNILYVDGENTGLTIEKCNLIIDCVINDPNKQECVNRLIKNYSSTKPKYIRILADEYNNVNLSKVLEKKVARVERIDNPQKRKEMGVYL